MGLCWLLSSSGSKMNKVLPSEELIFRVDDQSSQLRERYGSNRCLVLQRDFTSEAPPGGSRSVCDATDRPRVYVAADRQSTPGRRAGPARAAAVQPATGAAPVPR